MMAFAYISPRRVLTASTRALRWQFWGLVAVGVGAASVTVLARGEASVQPEWMTYWPVLISLILFVFNLGITWQQLAETKRRIERLEGTQANKEATAERFDALNKDLDAFGVRFEAYLATVQSWTTKVEAAVNHANESIARLDERVKAIQR